MVLRCRLVLSICLLGLLAIETFLLPIVPPPSAVAGGGCEDTPRLAILVIFDQMRGDYLSRWDTLYGEKGFRRLQKEGTWFTQCHYPYANTFTAVGHASILCGCRPAEHGIIGNEWYDRDLGEEVSSVATSRYKRILSVDKAAAETPARQDGTKKREKAGASPERLLVPSFGDALKEATAGKARVVSLSMKDRSAVLPAGQHPDVCYWFDTETGQFVTSSYYRDQPHAWIAQFNRARPADRWFGQQWRRFRPDIDYTRYSGPDDVAGEGIGIAQGRVFPHPMNGGQSRPGKMYYQALFNSPFGNELLLDLAKRAIEEEHLGARDEPDLLCVSFSCNDPIGHCWGPDSQEVLDVTLRSDAILKELLQHLDARVGKARYLLAVTADHGICPLPEVARAEGKDAGRVSADVLGTKAEAFLTETFGGDKEKTRWIEANANQWIYLNRRTLKKRRLKSSEVEEKLASWLKQQPGVLATYTRTQLEQGTATDLMGERVRSSFYPERSGDVLVVLKPFHLFGTPVDTGTLHGTPHPYDTHVPILVYGSGIRAGVCAEEITPQAIATIFAHALGVRPPPAAKAPLPAGLFEKSLETTGQ